MKHHLFALSLLFFSFSFLLNDLEALSSPFSSPKQEEPKIIVHNRILAKPNGKPISTYDLMKKMDLAFYKQFPEYASSTEARFHFYQFGWKDALSDLIDKQLILADAKESKIEVSSGDVRQEIEHTFGPSIIENLDKAGFTFEEAFKMMQEDILIRRLVAGRVHSKAVRQVTPIKIKEAYDLFAADPKNTLPGKWKYRIVTVKERNAEKTQEAAKKAYALLMQGTTLDQLSAKLKEEHAIGRKGSLTVSSLIEQNDQELSKEYRKEMENLEAGMYSQPFTHKSRTTKATVSRILIVEEKIASRIPSYAEMEGKIKEKLMNEAIDDETREYLLRLRRHYHIHEQEIYDALPKGYEPFGLTHSRKR